MNSQDVTTIVAVISLGGSIVSLYFSRQALKKADRAISIEKSSHFVNHLKEILVEIDNWISGYEDLKGKYIKNYKYELVYEIDEKFREDWQLIWEYIRNFEYKLSDTYPRFFKKHEESRGKVFDRICDKLKNNGDTDEIEYLLDSRFYLVSGEYRKFIVDLITSRTDNFI